MSKPRRQVTPRRKAEVVRRHSVGKAPASRTADESMMSRL
jgi:hypothetical protein